MMNQASNSQDLFEDNQSMQRRPESGAGRSTFDQIKSTVADKLHSAADALHEKSSQPGREREGLSNYGHRAAGWLDRSADYIEDLNADQLKTDIKNQVRSHPGRALLIAGAAGLILGALFRRR
jgi:hypothetical protein